MGPGLGSSIEVHAFSSEKECICGLHQLSSYEKWPHLRKLSACTFAEAGFYYAGRGDEVKCTSCGLTLAQWASGVHPLTVHRALGTGACQNLRRRVFTSDLLQAAGRDDEQLQRPNGRLTSPVPTSGGGRLAAASEDGSGRCLAAGNVEASAGTAASQPDGLIAGCFLKAFSELPLPPSIIRKNFLLKIPKVSELPGSSLPSHGSGEQQPLPRLREEALKFESYRLCTFLGVWEYNNIVHPRELARAGFYYAGPHDRVQCAFCQGLLRNWEPGDRAMLLHAQHFTYCRFVQGHDVGNVPIPFSALEQEWPEHEGTDEEVLGISRSTPQHGDLSVEARRLATFATWPASAHYIKPEDLARAGFFYIGGQDSVKCFYCNVVISVWPADSDAWVEHAKRSSSCLFLEQVKGMDFVQQHRVVLSSPGGSASQQQQTRFTVDPREIRARLDSTKVRILLRMEYPLDLVREAVQKRLSTVGDDHVSAEDLLASIFDLHDVRQRTQLEVATGQHANPAALPVVITAVGSHPAAPVSLSAAAPSHSSSMPALPIDAGRQQMQRLPVAVAASSHGSSLPAVLFSNAELQLQPSSGAGQSQSPPASWGSSLSAEASTEPQGLSARILVDLRTQGAGSEEESVENRQLKTQLTCKICMDSLVGIVFLPCGHFVSCAACAPALTTCPICRVSVRGTVRTFI